MPANAGAACETRDVAAAVNVIGQTSDSTTSSFTIRPGP